MDKYNSQTTWRIPPDAEILYSLNPQLSKLAHLEPASTNDDLAATIDGLNRAIASSDIIWELGTTAVLGLSPDIVMKTGYGIDTEHVHTANYIKSLAASIPSPEIHGILQKNGRGFVFMSRLKGEPLDKIWKSLNKVQKSSIKKQLGSIFSKIRSVPPPPPPSNDPRAIFGGGIPRRCKDARRHLRIAEGPISNEREFNDFLISDPQRTRTQRVVMIHSFLDTDHRLVMTHGDLHPRNIMATQFNDGSTTQVNVTGILDWEMCGYYPEYWEYVKSLHTITPRDGLDDWWSYLPESIGIWPKEYAVDLMISRWRG